MHVLVRCGWLSLLASCGGGGASATAAAAAAPIVAPMVARERLLDDLGREQAAARQRAVVAGDVAADADQPQDH
jgi:hypothetical protein